jgi:NAD(P)-dependent dehydrogenase (short-subunit alcohol dehydrogenase family)
VHLVSATEAHAKDTISNISKEVPNAPSLLKHHQVDLGSLQDVKALLPTLAGLERIDLLFLIAGIGVAPFGLTKDGLPNHFAVNHLSHMLIADGVLPKMIETSKQKAASGNEADRWTTRIVSESSELHRAAPSDVKCESVEEFSQEIDETKLYGRSKLFM